MAEYDDSIAGRLRSDLIEGGATEKDADYLVKMAEVAGLRLRVEHLEAERDALKEQAAAYADAVTALSEVRGAPLSTTIGYLIRAGYLVPAKPSVLESTAYFKQHAPA